MSAFNVNVENIAYVKEIHSKYKAIKQFHSSPKPDTVLGGSSSNLVTRYSRSSKETFIFCS